MNFEFTNDNLEICITVLTEDRDPDDDDALLTFRGGKDTDLTVKELREIAETFENAAERLEKEIENARQR